MKKIVNWLKEKYFNFIETQYVKSLNRKKSNKTKVKTNNIVTLSKDLIVRMDKVRHENVFNKPLNEEFLAIEKNKRNRLFNKLKKFKMLMDNEYIDISKESGKSTINSSLLINDINKENKKPYIDRDNVDVERIKDNNKK